jgi:hypothetical protein
LGLWHIDNTTEAEPIGQEAGKALIGALACELKDVSTDQRGDQAALPTKREVSFY